MTAFTVTKIRYKVFKEKKTIQIIEKLHTREKTEETHSRKHEYQPEKKFEKNYNKRWEGSVKKNEK